MRERRKKRENEREARNRERYIAKKRERRETE